MSNSRAIAPEGGVIMSDQTKLLTKPPALRLPRRFITALRDMCSSPETGSNWATFPAPTLWSIALCLSVNLLAAQVDRPRF